MLFNGFQGVWAGISRMAKRLSEPIFQGVQANSVKQRKVLNVSQFEENQKKIISKKLRALIENWEKANGTRLTQTKLAQALNVSRETVNSWLNEKNMLSEEYAAKLCEFFSVPQNYFSPDLSESLLTSEKAHKALQAELEENAKMRGLNLSLISFLKETPALADSLVSASWISSDFPSDLPAVDSPFLFSSSSGVKIYLPDETLLALEITHFQEKLSDYARFLLTDVAREIKRFHTPVNYEDSESLERLASGFLPYAREKFPCFSSVSDAELLDFLRQLFYASAQICLFRSKTGLANPDITEIMTCIFAKLRKVSPETPFFSVVLNSAFDGSEAVEILKSSGAKKLQVEIQNG